MNEYESIFSPLLVLGLLAFTLLSYALNAFLLGRVFEKAGVDMWKAWVPVYNTWTFLELGNQKGWLSLLLIAFIIPLIGNIGLLVLIVYMAIAAYKIGRGFGKEGLWVLLYIAFPIIWFAIIAFDKSHFDRNRMNVAPAYASMQNYGSYPQQNNYGQQPQGYGPPPQQPQQFNAPQPQTYGAPPQNNVQARLNPYDSAPPVQPQQASQEQPAPYGASSDIPKDENLTPPAQNDYKRPILDENGNQV